VSVDERYGESLPTILERRRGIAPRRTLAAVGAGLVLAGLVYLLVLRDPLDGKIQYVHAGAPVFNVLLTPEVVRRVPPRAGELLRLQAGRGPVQATTTVRRLRLPAYRGDVAGLLPVLADAHARRLARTVPGFRLRADGKARVNTAPGYQVGFSFASPAGKGEGIDVLVVPPETPGVRDGVILSYRATRPKRRIRPRLRAAAKAMRLAFRSFEFGPDRL